jgi:gamma-glutamyl:cysteine ligase YbdK (ATP-grasp superfamily)
MAIAINRDTFSPSDHAAFRERLVAQLAQLADVVERPGFGSGPPSLGAEVEMPLVGADGRPRAVNLDVLAALDDPRATVEIANFNIECNLSPVPAAGRPFSALAAEMRALLDVLAAAAAPFGARPLPIGILPSVTRDDVGPGSLTEVARYHALERGLTALRQGPARLRINGEEPLALDHDGVTFEGANTSFQVHVRIPPARFADTYNAAQLVTPLAVAVAGNSPVFLGHLLWEETRIAVFKQSTEARTADELGWHRPARVAYGHGWVRHGVVECFAESVHLHPAILPVCDADRDDDDPPRLAELRLHQGTVWRWNRAIYDPAGGGHVRVELRALPSGPTPDDMAANAAFLVGLVLGVRDDVDALLPAFPFLMADTSFYRAARDGLAARLLWPDRGRTSPVERSVGSLVDELLPVAAGGLVSIGVDDDEIARLLGIIERRVRSGQTGATWQRRGLHVLRARIGREAALPRLVQEYAVRADAGRPVHEWEPV